MSFSSRNNPSLLSQAGFTLLEVLISITLLVIISLAIYQATTETYRLRDILQHEGDFYNGVRMAMGVVDRDVSMLYSPTLMLPTRERTQPYDARDMAAIMSSDAGRSTTYWTGAVEKTGIRPSRFNGVDQKLTFVSASHIRVYRDRPESEFQKVSYWLDDDKSEGAPPGSKVLIRRTSPTVFSDDGSKEETKAVYPLLRGISKFKFRYFNREKQQWNTGWDSDSPDLKNRYPDLVEIVLEVKGPSRLAFEGTYLFRPEVPLHGLEPSL